MRRVKPNTVTVEVTHEAFDGDTKAGRVQYGFDCEVVATVTIGTPAVLYDRNGDGHPAEPPTVEIKRVTVREIVVYRWPDFTQGVSLDPACEHLQEVLESYAPFCAERLETDDDFIEKALEAAGEVSDEMMHSREH